MNNGARNVMRSVKMDKGELLKIVIENREKHIAAFNESIEDYKVVVLTITKANLKLAKTADLEKIKEIRALTAAPQSYENSYTKAIRMLELSVEDEINVEEEVFNQLVLDEWSWKFTFDAAYTSNKAFIASAR